MKLFKKAAAIACALALVPTPAQATEWDTAWPEVIPYVLGPARVIVYEPVTAIPARFKFARALEDWKQAVPGLNLSIGQCADNPRVHCVRVEAIDLGPGLGGSFGVKTDWSSPYEGTISLNLHYDPANAGRLFSCHEIGHSLGVTHHSRGEGCVASDIKRPGQSEIDALNEAYSGIPRQHRHLGGRPRV